MAVKKYRPGQVVDLGVETRETPLDKLIKLMQVGQGIGQAVDSIRTKADNTTMNVISVAQNLLGRADNPEDVNIAMDMLNNISESSNPAIDSMTTGARHIANKQSERFADFQTKGNQLYSKLKEWDVFAGKNVMGMSPSELNTMLETQAKEAGGRDSYYGNLLSMIKY